MKTKHYSVLLILFLALCCVPATQSQEQEARPVPEHFTRVSVGSGIDLFITQGEPVTVTVEADNRDMDRVVTDVEGDVLKIFMRSNVRWVRTRSVKVHLTMPEITSLSVSGGADLRSTATINTQQLSVDCSGGADAYLSVIASDVELSASGGADIDIKGEATTLNASASGGADIDAKNLKAQKAVVEASGGADISVYASEEIKAHASGGSDIDYYGSPAIKAISKSGGGDVTEK